MSENNEDLVERGKALRERRDRHGIKQPELARAIGLKDRTRIYFAEKGDPSAAKTLARAERYLDDYELALEDPHGDDDGMLEFRIEGNFGVSIVVRGPVADHAALEESALRIMQRMNSGDPQ